MVSASTSAEFGSLMGGDTLSMYQQLSQRAQKGKITPEDISNVCATLTRLLKSDAFRSYAPLLPLILSLKGKPYTLYDNSPGSSFFPMETMYKRKMPFRAVWKCGRQVSKSTSLAAQGLIQSVTMPFFSTLFVTPLYEMTRRFSNNYVRPFIDQSPLRNVIMDSECHNSVLQRQFVNNSLMFFTFAFLDCERARGISADKLVIDEVQNLDWDFLGVLRECMSASRYGVSQYSGTPKTNDNTIELLWQDSSMAELVVKCLACNHWNIPNLKHDVLKMIGKEGIKCAKCDRPINPKDDGEWVHQVEDLKYAFAGYHIPQIIMPMHYELINKWAIIWEKFSSSKVSQSVFFNECLGESCDVGSKLLSIDDLKSVSISTLHNSIDHSCTDVELNKYIQITMGVDWGGQTAPVGRGKQLHMAENPVEAISYTTIAIMGQKPNGTQQCIYGYRLPLGVNHQEEIQVILKLFKKYRCAILAHDFGGSGSVRETLLVQAGVPANRIMPLIYVASSTDNLLVYRKPSESSPRYYYSLDKTRSLLLTCAAIKTKNIFFPNYEETKDLTADLLALMEDKIERPHANDIMRIVRQPKKRDDFAHSVNYGAVANWHTKGTWPKLEAVMQSVTITDKDLLDINPYHQHANYEDPS